MDLHVAAPQTRFNGGINADLAMVPYFGVQAFSWLISLWTNKLARYLITAVLLLGAGFAVKVYLSFFAKTT
jgi:hypothetical protein